MRRLVALRLEDAPEGGIFSAADNPSKLPPFGDWGLVTWLHGVNWEWRVLAEGSRKVLEHSTIYTSCLRAGDGTWGDFAIEFDVRQMLAYADTSMDELFNTRGRAGVMFRYQSYRRTYALFLETLSRIVLYKRIEHDWICLAERPIEIDPGTYYRLRVECTGERIRCFQEDKPLFDVTDSTYRRGRVAVFANTLSRFGSVSVDATDEQLAEGQHYARREAVAAAKSAEGLAKPVLWKAVACPPGKRLALDVTPAGELTGVVVLTTDARFASLEHPALVSFGLDGEVRWSQPASREAIPRVWDLDGDGRQEVVLFDGPVLKLIDAATGRAKVEAPTPPCNRYGNRGGREDQTPYAPVYSFFAADVRGRGPGRDVLLFDLYTAFWVVSDSLELVWWGNCEHGHDIGRYDIDGDGCDELLCGFTMFDHDGRELWTMPGLDYLIQTHDHVDHIAIGEFDGNPSNGLEIALVCGNAGFYLLDQEGRIRAQHDIGHAQSLQTGRFRPDLPGRQFLAGTRWGNPGTRVMFAGNGERLWTIEPDNSRAADLPVRWVPERDLFLAMTTPQAAGFYDGYGRRVLAFPDAELSVADQAYCAGDFTGNGLEDVVMITPEGLRIYTQETREAPGGRRPGFRHAT